jgi:diadenosine tetraphosphate (Ap4A) HIT family hydrolase
MTGEATGNCPLCKRIEQIHSGANPHFVAELQSGYVVIGDHQLFRGYSLLLCRQHVPELHLLDAGDRSVFLEEMAILGEAVYNAFHPVKLNYELLGNSIQHMHWHIFPRHEDDPCPNGPVWVLDRIVRYADSARPSDEDLRSLKTGLLGELVKLGRDRIRRDFRG